MKGKDKEAEGKEGESLNLTPADVGPMLADDMTDANLVLEGQSVGRGSEWIDASDGIKRIFQVETLGVKGDYPNICVCCVCARNTHTHNKHRKEHTRQ